VDETGKGLNPHAEGIKAGAISDEDAKFLSDIAHQVVTKGKRLALERQAQHNERTDDL